MGRSCCPCLVIFARSPEYLPFACLHRYVTQVAISQRHVTARLATVARGFCYSVRAVQNHCTRPHALTGPSFYKKHHFITRVQQPSIQFRIHSNLPDLNQSSMQPAKEGNQPSPQDKMLSFAPQMPAIFTGAWDHRPAVPSPLSSSPIRATSPLSPVDSNTLPQRQVQSSPIQPLKFKHLPRPIKPNPVVRRREQVQEDRRRNFFNSVKQKSEERAWQRRDIEGQVSHYWNHYNRIFELVN